MKAYQITESVAGNLVIVTAESARHALLKYIQECVVLNENAESWTFDFEIEEADLSKVYIIKEG